ncbi:DNA methylase [Carnobacterium iners]|uniref:DNA methylase n=1 Tax=Carnobacterium iners TaxID=1073423 RepID=A0A1X7MP23_9LACT|nr:DNA methyltransferase [Carnobacterium iners]SEK77904.1 DNA methylase [Carnobacterium iners]SMH26445.1 DNA methylase [Carnobacterium iners]
MVYESTDEVSKKWGISPRRIATLCQNNRINGARKIGKTWLIPNYIEKPLDGRKSKNNMNLHDLYKKMEEGYNVIYPSQDGATYTSPLNYSDDLSKTRQRWYRYKEGYSIELVKKIISDYCEGDNLQILDPFLGSGSTIIGANSIGHRGIGFEVNPFSNFLSECKLKNYTIEEAELFNSTYKEIIEESKDSSLDYSLPDLSISNKVFDIEVEPFFMKINFLIKERNIPQNVKNLLKLGWLSALEIVSLYRKAGNGLKKRKSPKSTVTTILETEVVLRKNYEDIYSDIVNNTELKFDAKIINDSSLNMSSYINDNSIDAIIFSPPYANCFDYTEIYKLELWFGDFVKAYSDLKVLRSSSLHSHLNGISQLTTNAIIEKNDPLFLLLEELKGRELWDKKIPVMLALYFFEMKEIIKKSYDALKTNGVCAIVVGNSAYGGVIFPTDLLLAKYAENIGFKVDRIEVDRYIITSSQQYEKTKKSKQYLRESILCLVK